MNEGYIYIILEVVFFLCSYCMIMLKMYNEFLRRSSTKYKVLAWVFILAMVVVGLIAFINKPWGLGRELLGMDYIIIVVSIYICFVAVILGILFNQQNKRKYGKSDIVYTILTVFSLIVAVIGFVVLNVRF